MLALALAAVVAAFGLLLILRVGGARRSILLQRWPSLLLAGAALFALARGAVWPATALAVLAALLWTVWPPLNSSRQNQQRRTIDPADAEARAILGVGLEASEQEIRSAYRAKMARAHPDRGGGHAEAARLTAARDRLLRNRR